MSSLVFLGAGTTSMPTQEDVNGFMTRIGTMEVSDSAYAAAGKTFEDGNCRWTFDNGVFVPVEAGTEDRRIVGVVFVGEGTLEVRFPDRGEAWNFANHMVVRGEQEVDAMAPVAHQEAPYRVPIERGFILSADDKIVRLLTGLDPLGSGAVYSETDDGSYDMELMVTDSRGRLKAVAQAYDLMAPRMTLLRKAGWDGELMVMRDRLLHEGLGSPPEELGLIGDFLTHDRYASVLTSTGPLGNRDDDQWMTCLRDGSGAWGLGRRQSVFSHGTDARDTYIREEFGGAVGQAEPMPVRSVHADTTVRVAQNLDKITLGAEVDQRLTFYAEREVRHLSVRLPREEALDGVFELLSIKTPEGVDVAFVEFTRMAADMPDWAFGNGNGARTQERNTTDLDGAQERTVDSTQVDVSGDSDRGPQDMGHTVGTLEVVLALPEAVAAGESFDLDFAWTAKWPYDVTYLFDNPGASAGAGTSSGFRSVVPIVVPTTARATWSYELDVGVPRGRKAPVAAVSGDTIDSWTEDGWTWTRSAGVGALRPGVALGAWRSIESGGQPTVKLHVFKSDLWALEEYPAEVRRSLDFMESLVGKLPMSEIEVYQGPAATAAGGRLVGQGVLEVLQPWTTPTPEVVADNPRREPRNEHISATRQLAIQYFGRLLVPHGARNAWLGSAIPDAYGSFYIRDVFGEDWYWAGVDGLRYMLEDKNAQAGLGVPPHERPNKSMTLTSTRQALYGGWRLAGAYLFTSMLPRETGWAGLLAGLQSYQQSNVSRDVTSEDLKQALEASSGKNLDDFWDYWVTGSLIPKLKTSWTRTDETTVDVCIESDVPFGRFEVSVAVMDRGKERVEELLITVEDGVGRGSLPDREGKVQVVLDPGGFILTESRRTRKLDELPQGCSAEK